MAKIFSMSEAASIAIHSMVLIARNENGINAVKIAEQTGSSKNHISKVAQRLVKNDLLKSVRGPLGGFTLKKSPADITSTFINRLKVPWKLQIVHLPMKYVISINA